MPSKSEKHLFVSYARQDADSVKRIVNALQEEYRARALPIDVWFDAARLRPGELWDESIRKALLDSFGLLIFVSPASMNSSWVREELRVAAVGTER